MQSTDPSLSWTGSRWSVLDADSDRIARIRAATGLSPIAARCLALRCGDEQSTSQWLRPSLDHLLDPYTMRNMEAALDRLRKAALERQHVRIITDYDVDGTTSSLILQAALRLIAPDCRIDYHIPNRFHEGYGFSEIAAAKAIEDGVDLIVTADIGVRDHASVQAARNGGVDVLVCDHHLPAGESVPQDAIVLCPPQEGCDYGNPALAACGVSLKLAQALLADHRRVDAITTSLLKLAAIGTVADLVPLTTPENRAIVRLGLDALNRGPHHPGLEELIRVCRLSGPIDEGDLGFRIGPRINAAGRIEDANLVVELMTGRDRARAVELAAHIDGLNSQRQTIQKTVYEEAMAAIGTGTPDPFIVVAGHESGGWHRGVVGIVASKIKDKLNRPAAVVSIQGDHAVGSIRSVEGVHAVRALDSASDLLVRYGGHPMAAGFTVSTGDIDALRERLGTFVDAHVTDEDRIRTRRVDAEAELADLDWDLFHEFASLGPYGMKNPRPRVWIRGVRATDVRSLANGRLLAFRIPHPNGGTLRAIWWNQGERASTLADQPLDLLGQLGQNTWKNRTELQFEVQDARPA